MQNDPNNKFHDEYCEIKIKNLLSILNKEHLGYSLEVWTDMRWPQDGPVSGVVPPAASACTHDFLHLHRSLQ